MTMLSRFVMVLLGLAFLSASATKVVPPVPVALGQRFSIELESNASTGYQWKISHPFDERVVRLTNHRYVPPAQTREPVVGAPGMEVWAFQATGKGTAEIQLEYVRPWEKGAAPAEIRSYRFVVQ